MIPSLRKFKKHSQSITLRYLILNLGIIAWITSHQWLASKNNSNGFDVKIYENDDACAKYRNKEDDPGYLILLVH